MLPQMHRCLDTWKILRKFYHIRIQKKQLIEFVGPIIVLFYKPEKVDQKNLRK